MNCYCASIGPCAHVLSADSEVIFERSELFDLRGLTANDIEGAKGPRL